jgi:hypothetical protein
LDEFLCMTINFSFQKLTVLLQGFEYLLSNYFNV